MSTSRRQPSPPRARAVARPTLESRLKEAGLILLFDGTCALCHGTVQWILARDPSGSMLFAPLDSAVGRQARQRLPSLAGIDSVVLLHAGGAWVKSTAVLEIARYVGGIWTLALAGYLIPRRWRDALYDAVARRRYARFGRAAACDLPTEATRARLLLDA